MGLSALAKTVTATGLLAMGLHSADTPKPERSAPMDFEILPLPYLFTVSNRSGDTGKATGVGENPNTMLFAREYIQTLYPESFVKSVVPVKLNGRRELCVHPLAKNTRTVEKHRIEAELAGEGYAAKDVSFPLISTSIGDVVDRPVLYMHIGSSSSVSRWGNACGEYEEGGYNHISFTQELAEKDALDFGVPCKFKTLGHAGRTVDSFGVAHFTYHGEKHSFRSFSEGGSGTGLFYMCLYPISVQPRQNPTDIGDKNVNAITALAVWDFLGLGTRQPFARYTEGAPYTEPVSWNNEGRCLDPAGMQLARSTPFGRYHWDYTERLWNNLTALTDWARITGDPGGAAWMGSPEQKKLVDTYLFHIAEHPRLGFYSFEKAQQEGSVTAFSFQAYLDRYRTLDDTGRRLYTDAKQGTRKALGSRPLGYYEDGTKSSFHIGSEVTDTGTYDVCTPTHFTMWYGHADWVFSIGSTCWTDIIPEHKLLIQDMIRELHTANPAMRIGLGVGRLSGAMNPGEWNDRMVSSERRFRDGLANLQSQIQYQLAMNEWMLSLSDLDGTINYVPVWAVSPVTAAWSGTMQRDLAADADKLVVWTCDSVHGGLVQQRCVGFQYYAWILYTLAQSLQPKEEGH